MIKLLVRVSLILLVINQIVTPCSAFGSYRNRDYQNDRGHKSPTKTNNVEVPSQTKARRGLGISAWGIVILIVAIILAVMGLYYYSICYPSICRKNTKYNLMEKPTLA